jgi:hypothetical protein
MVLAVLGQVLPEMLDRVEDTLNQEQAPEVAQDTIGQVGLFVETIIHTEAAVPDHMVTTEHLQQPLAAQAAVHQHLELE